MERVVLSLGTNLGDREKNISNALEFLSEKINKISKSRNLANKAILKEGAPKEWNREFLNCVIVGETKLSPQNLLKLCKEIEVKIGRDLNSPVWSPREIDIDILYYGALKIDTPTLTIPHKELKNRKFLTELYDEINL